MDSILILDFGGQTSRLLARRFRELGIYSEVVPGDFTPGPGSMAGVKGLVLSGSPASVRDPDAPMPRPEVFRGEVPALGIGYGLYAMTLALGGDVADPEKREYGASKLQFTAPSRLFRDVPDGFLSWMGADMGISSPAPGFSVAAVSEKGLPAAFQDESRRFYGLQFHPEATPCEYGAKILENFARGVCGVSDRWSMESYLDTATERVRREAGDKKVLLLISGGVDSTVVGALLLKALPPENVHLMYIDTGLMRKNESVQVARELRSLGARNLHLVDASERFLTALRGIQDPEAKRHAIGDTFIRVQEEEVAGLRIPDALLAQGTIYPDLIESGGGAGGTAGTIKSHHNVRSPLVEEKRRRGLLIEPLDRLFKDEVRELGRRLGVSPAVLGRHPFPGPGLGVRVLGEVTREKCDILREADAVYLRELEKRGLYDRIWQAFSILLPVRSVGVVADRREYGHVLALRAVTSQDGMTAQVFDFPTRDLVAIASEITDTVRGIGRVVYDISNKPPATIEWE